MKSNISKTAPCPACQCRMTHYTYPDTPELSFWYCAECGIGYADKAGVSDCKLPLTLPQTVGIVAIVQRHPDLFGVKKFFNDLGKSSIYAVSQLKQATEEGYFEIDPQNGNFILTEMGRNVAANLSATCPTCGGIVLKHDTESTGLFWKCINCATHFADADNKPAQPETCSKCGGVAVTRYEVAERPGHYFWGCGACRLIFEDVSGSAGRCTDDINE